MRNRIALHAEPRKTIIASLAFTLISFFLMLILILSVNKDAIQLNSLLQSDYDYSVTMQDTVRKDDYYQFNAGIEFTLSDDANTSLNADIVMQSKDSLYTDMVSWNAEPLSTNGVAVSENVAKSNNLHIGDKLYSKHIVNGDSCEYTIEQLLPEAVSVRVTNGMNHSDGIIIMGYDERYIENITHSFKYYEQTHSARINYACLSQCRQQCRCPVQRSFCLGADICHYHPDIICRPQCSSALFGSFSGNCEYSTLGRLHNRLISALHAQLQRIYQFLGAHLVLACKTLCRLFAPGVVNIRHEAPASKMLIPRRDDIRKKSLRVRSYKSCVAAGHLLEITTQERGTYQSLAKSTASHAGDIFGIHCEDIGLPPVEILLLLTLHPSPPTVAMVSPLRMLSGSKVKVILGISSYLASFSSFLSS